MKSLSCVLLLVTLWTVAHQAPLSMGFSRQEYWSGVPFPSPGDLPNPGIEPMSLALQADSLQLSHWRSPLIYYIVTVSDVCVILRPITEGRRMVFLPYRSILELNSLRCTTCADCLIAPNFYLFLTALGLHCGVWASLLMVQGLSCPTARGILIPRPEINPSSPALKGGFLTTGSPEKSCSKL